MIYVMNLLGLLCTVIGLLCACLLRCVVSCCCHKAEILNDFFISVLVHEPEDLQLPTFRCDNINSSLFDVHISEDEVRSKLLKLKPNKSSGPDNIHVNVLRNVPNLSIPLAKIFQLSMNTGVVPQDWRDAHVTPLLRPAGNRISMC